MDAKVPLGLLSAACQSDGRSRANAHRTVQARIKSPTIAIQPGVRRRPVLNLPTLCQPLPLGRNHGSLAPMFRWHWGSTVSVYRRGAYPLGPRIMPRSKFPKAPVHAKMCLRRWRRKTRRRPAVGHAQDYIVNGHNASKAEAQFLASYSAPAGRWQVDGYGISLVADEHPAPPQSLRPPAASAGMSSMCSFATDLMARSLCQHRLGYLVDVYGPLFAGLGIYKVWVPADFLQTPRIGFRRDKPVTARRVAPRAPSADTAATEPSPASRPSVPVSRRNSIVALAAGSCGTG